MFKEYINDYYLLKISLSDICKKSGAHQSTFYRYLDNNNLPARRVVYGRMDLGDEELNRIMKDKYASIVKRCNGRPSYEYKEVYEEMVYMPINEWVDLCNENKDLLLSMWNEFKSKGRDRRYSISIDRIDNNKGYALNNIQFVTHGFNAWKRNVRPISVTYNGKTNYFMSSEEASNYYGIRRQTIGDVLRGQKRLLAKEYFPEHSTTEKVLEENRVSSLEGYYNVVFKENHKPRKVRS